ncbi:MAG: PPC domain-containing protein [Pirellulales bacterium]
MAHGATTEVTATGTFPKWPTQAWVGGDGVRFEPLKDKGKFRVVVDPSAVVGVRAVRLVGDDGASKVRPFVISSIAETAEKETNDLTSKPQDVGSEPIVVNGALAKAGDVDCYRVSLKKGQTFVASLDANFALGSPIDAVLQLTDTAGFVVDQNHDDRGLDPRIVRTIAADGDYVVRVFAFASDPNSSIRYHGAADAVYRLTLTTGPLVDHVFPLAVAAKDSEKPTSAELQGWSLSASPVNVAAAEFADLPFAMDLPDRHAGMAFAISRDVPSIVESEPNDRAKPQAIATPCVVNARMNHADDRDEYLVTWRKGESWRIRATSKALGFAVDPLVRVFFKDERHVFRSDDIGRGNPDVDGTFKVPADGTYRVVVEDTFGSTSSRHLYLLDVRAPDADFALTTTDGEFAAADGKPLEIPVTVERPAGMTAEIEVRLEGLPKAFGEPTAVSASKGDTAKKVVLKIPSAAAFSGPVRIVGTAKSEAQTRRVATAAVVGPAIMRIEQLWLTLPAAKK